MSAVRIHVLLLCALVSLLAVDHSSRLKAPAAPATTSNVAASSSKLPVRFEKNAGQWTESVRFVARKGPSSIFLGDRGATLSIRSPTEKSAGGARAHREDAVVNLTVAVGRLAAPEPSDELVTKTHYLRGSDRSKWRTDVPSYGKITYANVLDGVDLVYHGENGAIEYDFVVAPGTNVDAIAMNVDGATDLALDGRGDLRIHTRAGDIVQARPVVYQHDANGDRRRVGSSYRLVDRSKVGFVVAAYDRERPLVIDPIIGFASYLGGSSDDEPTGIAADAAGNAYVTGGTLSDDFPPGVEPAEFDTASNATVCTTQLGFWDDFEHCGSADAFVAKINAAGTAVLWMTYLGGDQSDAANAIALGPNNEPFVTGVTFSHGDGSVPFPVSEGPAINKDYRGAGDGFLTRLQADGKAVIYSTLLRGFGQDEPRGVAVDAAGNAFVTGSTSSIGDFLDQSTGNAGAAPAAGPPEGSFTAFVVKVNATGSAAEWLNMMPISSGSIRSNAIAIDTEGRAYITGQATGPVPASATTPIDGCASAGQTGGDVFIGRLQASGVAFEYLTCLHGGDADTGLGIALDANRNAYVGGMTWSTDFATKAGSYQVTDPDVESADGFVLKLNPLGTETVFSTYLGGVSYDDVTGITVDASNTAWVTGSTRSSNFPRVPNLPGNGFSGGEGRDAFIARFDATGSDVTFSQFYGGTSQDFGAGIVAQAASIFVVGGTYSSGPTNEGGNVLVPAAPGALQNQNNGVEDCFVIKASNTPLLISPVSVVVAVGGDVQFSAVGGSGGYSYAITQNNSSGTIDGSGTYVAGQTGGVTDVVTVTDVAGATADALVNVGFVTSELTISPSSTNSPPRGTRVFTANGGTPPYTFSFASNASNGTISQTGSYTAGPRGSVTDVVRVTDATGISSFPATIRVGEGVRITPAQPQTPPLGTINFAATGGAGAPYTWSLVNSASTSSSIDPTTGRYTAGSGANSVDTVQAIDALGNKATVQVSVGGGLAIAPDNPTTTTRGQVAFTAFGGSGVFTWSLTTAPSGGSIDPGTGVYTAGSTGNAIDVVRVDDSVGNSRQVEVTVGPALTLLPTTAAVLAGTQLAFSGAGGSGVGYGWTLSDNQSGATIDASGLYTAGVNAGTDTVRLTDSLGSTASAVVAVSLPPGGPGTTTGIPGQGVNGITIGGGGNEDCTCRAVGRPASGTSHGLIAGLALAFGSLVIRRRRR